MGQTCKTCGLENPANASNCARCGAFLTRKDRQGRVCGFCGKANAPTAEICEFCGAHLLQTAPESLSSLTGVPSGETFLNPATPEEELPPPEIIPNLIQTPPADFPQLPPLTAPPVKKPVGKRVKSIVEPILLGLTYVGFIGVVVWIIIALTGL